VPSIKIMDSIASKCLNKVCRISSQHKIIDQSASVFISTSVSDAGLTIPDVSFVLSPDVDVTVLQTEDTPKAVYFKLPSTTISQRAGRTGRTSDGAFLLYQISDVETSSLSYSLPDYLMALSPATTVAAPYFPDNMTDLDVVQRANLEFWDLIRWPTYAFWKEKYLDRGYSMANLLRGMNFPDSMIFTQLSSFFLNSRPTSDQSGVPEFNFVSFDTDSGRTFDKDLDPLHGLTGEVPYLPSIKIRPYYHSENTFKRINVSGDALLCGLRCIIGAVFTANGYRLSESFVLSAIHDVTLPELWASFSNFFEWTQLRQVLFVYFHIRARLISSGSLIPDPPEFDSEPTFPFITLFLDHGHYNYLGVPYLGAPEEDHKFNS